MLHQLLFFVILASYFSFTLSDLSSSSGYMSSSSAMSLSSENESSSVYLINCLSSSSSSGSVSPSTLTSSVVITPTSPSFNQNSSTHSYTGTSAPLPISVGSVNISVLLNLPYALNSSNYDVVAASFILDTAENLASSVNITALELEEYIVVDSITQVNSTGRRLLQVSNPVQVVFTILGEVSIVLYKLDAAQSLASVFVQQVNNGTFNATLLGATIPQHQNITITVVTPTPSSSSAASFSSSTSTGISSASGSSSTGSPVGSSSSTGSPANSSSTGSPVGSSSTGSPANSSSTGSPASSSGSGSAASSSSRSGAPVASSSIPSQSSVPISSSSTGSIVTGGSSSSLSNGAIAGIVVGVVVGFALLAIAFCCVCAPSIILSVRKAVSGNNQAGVQHAQYDEEAAKADKAPSAATTPPMDVADKEAAPAVYKNDVAAPEEEDSTADQRVVISMNE